MVNSAGGHLFPLKSGTNEGIAALGRGRSCANRSIMPSLERFLARLGDESRCPIAAYNMAVVIAHPDEIVACGATLRRLRGAHLVVVTDGVPHGYPGHDPASASPEGTARWHELLAAVELAGHKPSAVSGLAVSQGNAAEQLVPIGRRLAYIFARQGTAIALTYAYEGDDSDRDATAFAVRKGAELCGHRGQDITVIEMLLASRDEDVACRLPLKATEIISLALRPAERALKERMTACFTAQSEVWNFAADAEQFRVPPNFDCGELLNRSEVLYRADEGCMSGAQRRPRAGFSAANQGPSLRP